MCVHTDHVRRCGRHCAPDQTKEVTKWPTSAPEINVGGKTEIPKPLVKIMDCLSGDEDLILCNISFHCMLCTPRNNLALCNLLKLN